MVYLRQSHFKVPSMHSLSSSRIVSSSIEAINGVKNVNIDYQKSLVEVFYEDNERVIEKIHDEVEKCGYKIKLL